jgi:hypothetical protein
LISLVDIGRQWFKSNTWVNRNFRICLSHLKSFEPHVMIYYCIMKGIGGRTWNFVSYLKFIVILVI